MAQKTIGSKIKNLRKQKGLTQEELAKILGYSGKSVIAHIEKGDADMTYEKMALLLKKFSLDANSLFNGEIVERKEENVAAPKAKEPKQESKEQPKEKETKKIVVYIHGLNGSYKEANDYKFLKDKYDLVGLDYEDGNPWDVGPVIKDKFAKLIKPYDEVYIIANSIGAFYAYEYLSDFKIKKAFFISPIVSMFQTIVDLMVSYGIKDKELQEEKFIELDDGTVLSYDFYQHVSNDEDHWKVPTEILYATYDEMVFSGSVLEFLETHPQSKLTVKSDSGHYFYTKEERQFVRNWLKANIDK